MNIHIICTNSKGFSENDFSSNFDSSTNITFSHCSKTIFSIEKALKKTLSDSEKPDLVIIDNVLEKNHEKSFRKTFAGIIYRAEKKIQEKPWIEVQKALKQKKKSNKGKEESENPDNTEELSRNVPYNKKKTHVFPITLENVTAYTFPYGDTQILVLPKGTKKDIIPELTEKAQQIFVEHQDEFPQGFKIIPKVHKILTFREKYLPTKEDSFNEQLRKVIQILACCTFLVAGVLFLNHTVFLPIENAMVQSEMRTLIYNDETDPVTGEKIIKQTNWKKLKKMNSEITGWIKINNTKIDYPVVWHKEDNGKSQYYLYRNPKKESSGFGSIFMDYRSTKGFQSKNAILHGHHMDDGSMFANLMKYGLLTGDLEFYKKAPTIQISTEKGGTETYKIFSVFKSNVDPKQGEYFDFYCADFKSDSQFMNYVYNLQIRSLITTPVTVNEDDKLLTLVTCSYEFDDFRTVVVARKCREGESKSVDTGKASIPPTSLWPQVYYNTYGRTRPVVSTFSEEYKKGNISWYDGDGKLEGSDELPTSTIVTEETTEESETTTAKSTSPGATEQMEETTKPVNNTRNEKDTYYMVQIYNRDTLIKVEHIKSGKSLKLPEIEKSYIEDGYKYTFTKWIFKGSPSEKKITMNTVVTAEYKKTKTTETAPTTPPETSSEEAPTDSDAQEGTEPLDLEQGG